MARITYTQVKNRASYLNSLLNKQNKTGLSIQVCKEGGIVVCNIHINGQMQRRGAGGTVREINMYVDAMIDYFFITEPQHETKKHNSN